MRKALAVLFSVFAASYANVAYANCSTHTYMVNGKMLTCTTCCYYGNCTTTCY
jgi:hypothetical protein